MDSKIINVTDAIDLIVLVPPISGFDNFIGAWLYRDANITILVDPGPAATVPSLCRALNQLHVDHIDFIFLTHIHIDHAGGTGDFAQVYPDARIICHRSGIEHLIKPERLWQGTVKVLGDTGRAYGKIMDVDENRFASAAALPGNRFEVIDTPGHAVHHHSLFADDCLFGGEAAGVCFTLSGGIIYHRPTTPPKFFLERYLGSIDALTEKKPEMICFGHFGAKKGALDMLERHKDQLILWRDLIRGKMRKEDPEDSLFMKQCIEMLLDKDPMLGGFPQMDDKTRKRELGFLANSIKGFTGYLKNA